MSAQRGRVPDAPAIEITPESDHPAAGDPLPSMISTADGARLRQELGAVIRDAAEGALAFALGGTGAAIDDAVAAFFDVFPDRPVVDNKGGSGFNDSLWLFLMARLLAPRLIVESGTFRGHSAWLFRQACPEAAIHSFDVNPDQLRHRDPATSYHIGDWAGADLPPIDAGTTLGFFDDHISHAKRMVEAHARGFRLLLFDDNFPAWSLYATGGPPVPTLAMIMDETLAFGRTLSWTRNGKTYAYTYEAAHVGNARSLIADYAVLPDLAPVTRYPPGSGLSVVRLVD